MKTVRLVMKLLAILLLGVALVTNDFLPFPYLLGIGVIEILLLLLVWKRKVLQIFVVLVMIFSSFVLLYTENIIARLVTYDPLQVNSVSFFTLKDSPILTVKSAVNKKIASSSLVEQALNDLILEELRDEGHTGELITYEGIYEGIELLYDGTIDVLVLDEAYLDTIIDVDPEFLTKTKVVWAVQNTIEKEVLNPDIDITSEPFTILVVANDNYGDISKNGRSDVNLLMTINPITHVIEMVTIPRDAYVHNMYYSNYDNNLDKLTHTGTRGALNTVRTVENLFNMKINYFIRLNFSSFLNIIDAIGTIDVYNAFEFTETSSKSPNPIHFPKGDLTLSAMEAFRFVRERKVFIDGDIQRGRNQQEVIKGMIKELTKLSTLSRIESIVSAVAGTIETNVTPKEIMAVARQQIQNLSFGWTLNGHTLKGTNGLEGTITMGFNKPLYVIHLNADSLAEVRASLMANLEVGE